VFVARRLYRGLSKPVAADFNGVELCEVIDNLSRQARVDLYLDPRGLEDEGLRRNSLVSCTFVKDTPLEVVLACLLDSIHLGLRVDTDLEVIRITSVNRALGRSGHQEVPDRRRSGILDPGPGKNGVSGHLE